MEPPTDASQAESHSAEQPQTPQDQPTEAIPPGVVRPDVFLLKDKDGNLQSFPGFRYEDFMEAWRLKHGLQKAVLKPRYHISSIKTEGSLLRDRLAELTLRIQIEVLTDQPVEVPLGLQDAILLEVLPDKGNVQGFVRFDPKKKRFAIWLHGKSGETHTLVMKMAVPLKVSDNSTTLSIALPRAVVSQFSLVVPYAVEEANVSCGLLTQSPFQSTQTKLETQGCAGEWSLTWSKKGKVVSGPTALLQVESMVTAFVGESELSTTSLLKITPLRGALDHCRIRLPLGAKLQSAGEGEYTWRRLEAVAATKKDNEKGYGGQRAIYEFRWPKPLSEPVELQIVTEQPLRLLRRKASLNIQGVTVIGAVRQSGHLALQADPKWRIEIKKPIGLQSVLLLPETYSGASPIEAFEFFQPTWSLPLTITRRPNQLRMNIQHWLMVQPNELVWQGEITCTASGKKLVAVQVQMPNWKLDLEGIGPSNLVNTSGIVVNQAGIVTIPFKEPMAGTFSLSIRARQSRAADEPLLSVPLPMLKDHNFAFGKLVVVTPHSVKIRPSSQGTRGLIELPAPTDAKVPFPVWRPRLLAYRIFLANPIFAGTAHDYAQVIQAHSSTDVLIEENELTTSQLLEWNILYKPVDRLQIDLPTAWANDPSLRVTLDGNPVTLELAPIEPGTASGISTLESETPSTTNVSQFSQPARRQAEIRLPTKRIGRIRVALTRKESLSVASSSSKKIDAEETVRQENSIDSEKETDADTKNHIVIPLAIPIGTSTQSMEVTVQTNPNEDFEINLQADAANWKALWINSSSSRSSRTFRAKVPQESLPLQIKRESRKSGPDILVERTWVQTTLLGHSKQVQVRHVLRTRKKQLVLLLHKDAHYRLERIQVNGKTAEWEPTSEGNYRISLRHTLPEEAISLGISMRSLNNGATGSSRRIYLPKLQGDVIYQRTYLQINLLESEYVLTTPSGWTNENVWRWLGIGWKRVPMLDSTRLAQWTFDDEQLPGAFQSANSFLASRYGLPTVFTVRILPRSSIILLGSGVTLSVGLVLLYMPFFRRPAVLLSIATAFLAVGLRYPDRFLLLGQASILGLGLAMLAIFLKLRTPNLLQSHRATTTGSSTAALSIPKETSPPTFIPGEHISASATAPTVSMQSLDPK